jgi:hypothetical protein
MIDVPVVERARLLLEREAAIAAREAKMGVATSSEEVAEWSTKCRSLSRSTSLPGTSAELS